MMNANTLPCRASIELAQHQDSIARAELALDRNFQHRKEAEIAELVDSAQAFEDMLLNEPRWDDVRDLLHRIYGYAHISNVPPEMLGELFKIMTEMGDEYANRIASKN